MSPDARNFPRSKREEGRPRAMFSVEGCPPHPCGTILSRRRFITTNLGPSIEVITTHPRAPGRPGLTTGLAIMKRWHRWLPSSLWSRWQRKLQPSIDANGQLGAVFSKPDLLILVHLFPSSWRGIHGHVTVGRVDW